MNVKTVFLKKIEQKQNDSIDTSTTDYEAIQQKVNQD